MYWPSMVSRCVQYTVSRYESPGSVPTNSSDWFFVMTTMWPLDDGLLGRPRLTGIVLTTWSCTLTVIVLAALSVSISTLLPIEAVMVRSSAPYAPVPVVGSPPMGSPAVATRRVNFVFSCQ